jgi:hypothetical protein
MLNFLFEQGVEIDSDSLGFDALDIALQQFDLQTTKMKFVSRLMLAGAKVELSHKQIVDNMKINNIPAYVKLTSTYSELKL